MAEFEGIKEKNVGVGEPITFENKTDSDFDVDTGIIFHKSGIYEVSISGKRTVVSKVTERKTGKWIPMQVSSGRDSWKCSVCGRRARGKKENLPFCHCGADMRGDAE